MSQVRTGGHEYEWLGAEALPDDLAEINRVYQAVQEQATSRDATRVRQPFRPAGLIALAQRWLGRSGRST